MEPKIYEYLQGQLTKNERQRVEDHLATCTNCRADYIEWRELEACLTTFEIQPPQDFTLRVMEVIKTKAPLKNFKNYWFAGWYRNIGRGLIAAGILGIFINCSAIIADIPLDKSFEKAFFMVEEVGNRYMKLYEQVSFDGIIWNKQGGINNEM